MNHLEKDRTGDPPSEIAMCLAIGNFSDRRHKANPSRSNHVGTFPLHYARQYCTGQMPRCALRFTSITAPISAGSTL